jgi:glycosyltransferase involved in cell wall biosynthesis
MVDTPLFMKILLITDSLAKGGKERRMLELMKGLRAYPDVSYELVLFSQRIDYPEVHDMGIPVHILERKPKKDPRVFSRFYRLCQQLRPDVIHSWGSMPSIYAVPAAKLLGIKLINAMIADAPAGMGLSDGRYLRGKLTFPFSDLVLGNSEAGLASYDAPANRSQCVYNGFDFRRVERLIAPKDIRARLGITTAHVVGMIGAFEDRKDYASYLQAAMQVVKERDDVTFLAVGDGKNKAACEALVPAAWRSRIVFTGLQSDVESIIRTFTLGVLATNHTKHGEGISNAILEYMALGKPVVATIGGGTAEIVLHEETGLLVEPGKPDLLAQAITQLLDHPHQARHMGEASQARIERHFNLGDMTDTYYRLYHQVLKNHGVHTH